VRTVALRFGIGERSLVTVHRDLVPVVWSLDDLLEGRTPTIPDLGPADGYIFRSAPAALQPVVTTPLLRYARDAYPRYYARLAAGADAWLGGLSASTRSTLRRKSKKFDPARADPDVRIYRTAAELTEFHSAARALSARTYQERLLDAGLPDDPAFCADMAARGDSGRAWGFILFADGTPAAYLYTPVDDGVALYAYLGYDPALADRSPGAVLQFAAMTALADDASVRLFDFTQGEGQHKRQFATGHVDCVDLLLLRSSLANRSLVAAHGAFDAGVAAASSLARRTGLDARLRRLLRGGG
jgi:hypothetical protein